MEPGAMHKRQFIRGGAMLAGLAILSACVGDGGGDDDDEGSGSGRRRRDRDNNPPGPRGGPGTNWENPRGPEGGQGASPDR
jgi:hypothetical protein